VAARSQVDHVKAERNLLAEVNNPSIVKLFYSFQARAHGGGLSAPWLTLRGRAYRLPLLTLLG